MKAHRSEPQLSAITIIFRLSYLYTYTLSVGQFVWWLEKLVIFGSHRGDFKVFLKQICKEKLKKTLVCKTANGLSKPT